MDKITIDQERLKRFQELIDFIKREEGITEEEIAKNVGYDPAVLNKSKRGKDPLSTRMVKNFAFAYPELHIIDYVEKNIGSLKSGTKILNDRDATLKYRQPTNEDSDNHRNDPILVYNLDEQNGTLLTHSVGILSFPGSQSCDFAVYYKGEAMRGAICNGGGIAVKEIFDKNIIAYGHIYLIQTQDMDYVRFIRKSHKPDHVSLHANNDTDFDDFDIHRDAIKRLFIVRKILNNES